CGYCSLSCRSTLGRLLHKHRRFPAHSFQLRANSSTVQTQNLFGPLLLNRPVGCRVPQLERGIQLFLSRPIRNPLRFGSSSNPFVYHPFQSIPKVDVSVPSGIRLPFGSPSLAKPFARLPF